MPLREPTAGSDQTLRTSDRSAAQSRAAHNNIGVIQQERGDLTSAASAYQQAIESDPQFGLAWFNRGNCLREANRLSEAIADYRRAFALMPADAETRINLATVLRELRRFDESLALLDEIPLTSSQWPKAEFNRSLVHFLRGEFGRGWDAYEARLQIELDTRAISELRWNGTPMRGQSILLLAEQGIGDQVMFASCLPDILQQTANCLVECDARLVSLFARSFPQITALAKTPGSDPVARVGPCAVVEWIGSLPRFLRRRVEDFPQSRCFLRPDPMLVAKWRSSLAPRQALLRLAFPGKGDATRKRVAGGRFRFPCGRRSSRCRAYDSSIFNTERRPQTPSRRGAVSVFCSTTEPIVIRSRIWRTSRQR